MHSTVYTYVRTHISCGVIYVYSMYIRTTYARYMFVNQVLVKVNKRVSTYVHTYVCIYLLYVL